MITECNGENCFFCRKAIYGNGIKWTESNNWKTNPSGEGLTSIYLHPECSADLGVRLIGDGRQADPEKVNPHKVALLLRTRLNHQT